MSTWLRAALALQVAFFALWAGQLMTSHRDGNVVWLATEPVDPRDLLSGHYVALRFRIATPDHAGCALPEDARSGPVWVQLAPIGDPVATADGMMPVSEPVACQMTPPVDPEHQTWIAGVLDERWGGRRIVYGIERFYVGEENTLRRATSGSVIGKVAINERFEPRLLALVTKERPTEIPAESP